MNPAQQLTDEIKRLAEAYRAAPQKIPDILIRGDELCAAIDRLASFASPQPAEPVEMVWKDWNGLHFSASGKTTDKEVELVNRVCIAIGMRGYFDALVGVWRGDDKNCHPIPVLRAIVTAYQMGKPQPAERKPLGIIPLMDDEELRNISPYGWCLYRHGEQIRDLSCFEQEFIDSAIRAAHGIGIPPADAKEGE